MTEVLEETHVRLTAANPVEFLACARNTSLAEAAPAALVALPDYPHVHAIAPDRVCDRASQSSSLTRTHSIEAKGHYARICSLAAANFGSSAYAVPPRRLACARTKVAVFENKSASLARSCVDASSTRKTGNEDIRTVSRYGVNVASSIPAPKMAAI